MKNPMPDRMRDAKGGLAFLCTLVALAGCHETTQVPEAGAVLLRVQLAAGAPMPDELRAFVYDDGGALWSDVRVPQQGALVPEGAQRLGTLLIQPGASQGTLRIEIRGLSGGARVVGGVLTIAEAMRGQGTFDVTLDAASRADADDDGVPDVIDDCPPVANPAQQGCPHGGAGSDGGADAAAGSGGAGGGGSGGGGGGVGGEGGNGDAAADAPFDGGAAGVDASDGGAGMDVAPDLGGGDASSCGVAGGCNKPLGAACSAPEACASGFCADGVCCANACTGPCRSCNQPNTDGVCRGYPAMTDPDFECTSGGMTCNGAGACGPSAPPGNKPNGNLCGGASECASGFCKDGVCCNAACNSPCQSCGTGTCQPVKRAVDAPECVAPMSCNATGKCV